MGNWETPSTAGTTRCGSPLAPDPGLRVRAEAFPTWALDTLTALVRGGDPTGAREAAATLAAFWDKAPARVEGRGFFSKALRTGSLLDEPGLANPGPVSW